MTRPYSITRVLHQISMDAIEQEISPELIRRGIAAIALLPEIDAYRDVALQFDVSVVMHEVRRWKSRKIRTAPPDTGTATKRQQPPVIMGQSLAIREACRAEIYKFQLDGRLLGSMTRADLRCKLEKGVALEVTTSKKNQFYRKLLAISEDLYPEGQRMDQSSVPPEELDSMKCKIFGNNSAGST